jgi:hypothetical protein
MVKFSGMTDLTEETHGLAARLADFAHDVRFNYTTYLR